MTMIIKVDFVIVVQRGSNVGSTSNVAKGQNICHSDPELHTPAGRINVSTESDEKIMAA